MPDLSRPGHPEAQGSQRFRQPAPPSDGWWEAYVTRGEATVGDVPFWFKQYQDSPRLSRMARIAVLLIDSSSKTAAICRQTSACCSINTPENVVGQVDRNRGQTGTPGVLRASPILTAAKPPSLISSQGA